MTFFATLATVGAIVFGCSPVYKKPDASEVRFLGVTLLTAGLFGLLIGGLYA